MTDYFAVQLPPEQIRSISSIGLAHIGDAVYELLVRTWLCAGGKATGRGLHRAAVALVCAPRQAELAEKILPLLTQEEQDVFRRGRNANVHSIPAHASRAQYQQATALEALLDCAGQALAGGRRQQPQTHRLGGEVLGRQRRCRGQSHRGQEELGDGLDDEDHGQEPPGGQLRAAGPGLEAVAQNEGRRADGEH